MLKKIATLYIAIIFALAIFPNGQQAEAATTTYTFVKANYNETEAKDGTITRTLKSVTLQNSGGKSATITIANE